jgi:hypothetical protein
MFQENRIITGDDSRIRTGRGKPHGSTSLTNMVLTKDIYRLALEAINASTAEGGTPILPAEWSGFEDALAGVESAHDARMQFAWGLSRIHTAGKRKWIGKVGKRV